MLLLATTVVFLLILLNGLFAMSELAVVSSRRARLQGRAERGDRGARAALRLAEEPTRFLSAVQVGITLIGILAGAFGQATIAGELDTRLETIAWLAPWSEQIATGVVVVLLTYFSLILGELVPKRLALIHPEAIAAIVARPLAVMAKAMGPFVTLLTFSTATVLGLLRVRDRDGTAVTQEEVESVLAEGTGAGVIEPQEEAMMHEVMRLGDRPVRVAMTPRMDVYWVSAEADAAALREEVRACPYSRFVLVKGQDFDSPLGVVHKRDVADALLAGGPLDLSALAQEPLYIPETTSMLRALEQFKASKNHMAFVVDEFGGLEGILTPTDLLEMIAGDLPEEHDSPAAAIAALPDGSFLVDGRVDIVELNEALETDFEAGSYHTVAGLVLDRLERLPEPGEVVRIGRFEAEVLQMDARRIDKIRLRPLPGARREPGV
ncbi:CBS domain protein [Phenylobacterium zucineum HLK1]|uniref:CBS domain protein n=1 Tax=Phenylobacterium zucineum (strain HLK1) TaxID=450851 RepID=B4RCT8_PHEZH|nr:hemolysin family protein [Phenylobacterium zucineum]ACG78275.1 CBS domain protein [Phenylobacterium zucineum HLK1]